MLKPFYAVAHRCNSPTRVEEALKLGANAIECDVRVYNGTFWVHHDPIRDPANITTLSCWLNAARELADSYGDRFALVIFDVKDADSVLLDEMYSMVETRLTGPTGINVIWSVRDYADCHWFDRLFIRLTSRVGLAVYGDDDPHKVSRYLQNQGVRNICYAYGISDGNPETGVQKAIFTAAGLKRHEGIIRFVYVWTIDLRASMGDYVEMGIDGIITNEIGDLMFLIKLSCYSERLRLATRVDSPF
jgi:glycerophosphoryl diester phosphodiesterase